MTIDQDRNSRANNFTVSQNLPAGMRIPEYVFAQLIGFAMQNIRDTVDTTQFIDELFAFTSTEVIKQIKGYIREHKNIFIGVNWPREDAHLPLISCINQGETEEGDLALLGDAAGMEQFGVFGGYSAVRQAKAVPMRQVTNVYIASNDEELTMFLYNIVKFILISNKGALEQFYDIHNLTVSGQALEYDESKHPTRASYRMVQLQYLTWFDWNLSEEARRIVSLELLVEAQGDAGLLVVTEVPST